jgi:hypothetical protein
VDQRARVGIHEDWRIPALGVGGFVGAAFGSAPAAVHARQPKESRRTFQVRNVSYAHDVSWPRPLCEIFSKVAVGSVERFLSGQHVPHLEAAFASFGAPYNRGTIPFGLAAT